MIKQTTDYELFKHTSLNRVLCENALRKLQASIELKNMLEFRPIDVNPQMEVIDGQHRLEVAKRMGIPIWYQIKKDAEPIDIILLNNNQKAWIALDYLNYYVNLGNENYIKLQGFMKKHNIVLRMALVLLGQKDGRNKNFNKDFKEGKYIFNEQGLKTSDSKLQTSKIIIDFINKKTMTNKKHFKSTIFLHAIINLISHVEFELERFLKRLEIKFEILTPCLQVETYYKKLKYIYNWKNKYKLDTDPDEVEIDLGQELF